MEAMQPLDWTEKESNATVVSQLGQEPIRIRPFFGGGEEEEDFRAVRRSTGIAGVIALPVHALRTVRARQRDTGELVPA